MISAVTEALNFFTLLFVCPCNRPVRRRRNKGSLERMLHLLQHPPTPKNQESKRVHTSVMRRSSVTNAQSIWTSPKCLLSNIAFCGLCRIIMAMLKTVFRFLIKLHKFHLVNTNETLFVFPKMLLLGYFYGGVMLLNKSLFLYVFDVFMMSKVVAYDLWAYVVCTLC